MKVYMEWANLRRCSLPMDFAVTFVQTSSVRKGK